MGSDHARKGLVRRKVESDLDSATLLHGKQIVARVRKAVPATKSTSTDPVLHTVIHNMQEVVLLFDRNLRVIEASETAIEVMELPEGPMGVNFTPEINASHMTDEHGNQFPFEDSPPVRVVRGERFENVTLIWRHKNGAQGYFSVNGTPILNHLGEVEMGLLVGRDITQLREIQIRTQKMVAELSWSQRNWRRLIDNMSVGVILLDSELRIVEANRAYSREFGSTVRLRRGVRIDEALPAAVDCGLLDLLRKALESEKPVQVKSFQYDGIPNRTTYWNGSAVPVKIHTGNGAQLGLAMVLVDVTDEIEARDQLAEIAVLRDKRARELETEKARLNTIIQSTPIPLIVVDTHGRVLTRNEPALGIADIVGLSDWIRGEVAADKLSDLRIHDRGEKEIEPDQTPLMRSLRGETCVEQTMRLWRGGGSPRAVNINSAPLMDSHGAVTGAVLAIQDITEQLRAQDRISDIYRREHTIAEKLQSCFLPSKCPKVEGFEIGECYSSALDEALVGGDFYDIFRIGENQLGVVIADVSGKGLNAAVYTAMTKYMLRAYALEDSAPDRVLDKLNEALTECTPVEVFVTLVYGVLFGSSGIFRYANAGHEQPVFFSSRAGVAYNLDVTGRALALLHNSTYTACDVAMQPGDILALYTDGITDAGSGANRMGAEKVLQTVEASAALCASDLVQAVRGAALEFAGGRLNDDAALLVIKAFHQR